MIIKHTKDRQLLSPLEQYFPWHIQKGDFVGGDIGIWVYQGVNDEKLVILLRRVAIRDEDNLSCEWNRP